MHNPFDIHHFRTVMSDLLHREEKLHSHRTHLDAVIDWIMRAYKVTGGQGVSGAYSLRRGWRPAYPETTGYIIPTLIKYSELSGNADTFSVAESVGDWEIVVQLPSGAIRRGMGLSADPAVFNTGQVIQGWLALYRATSQERFLASAIRAGDWLVSVQDVDGKWSQHDFRGIPHSYQSRVSWPLFELHAISGVEKYRAAAEANTRWVQSCVEHNGEWIRQMSFKTGGAPFTHTIAYTLEGLQECATYLGGDLRQSSQEIVRTFSTKLMSAFELGFAPSTVRTRYLPGALDSNLNRRVNYSCLTGNAQLAIVFLGLWKQSNDPRFRSAGDELINQVRRQHDLTSAHPGVRGGVAGSFPLWGSYMPFSYPNWAAKFFADALMLSMESSHGLD